MKLNKTILVVLSAFVFCSCGNNEPSAYTSIKGSWHCAETSPMNSRTYLVDIYRTKADTTQYLISNFYNISPDGEYDVKATLIKNKLTISQQSIGSDYIVKSGSGTVNSNFTQIDLNYTIYDGRTDILVKAKYTR